MYVCNRMLYLDGPAENWAYTGDDLNILSKGLFPKFFPYGPLTESDCLLVGLAVLTLADVPTYAAYIDGWYLRMACLPEAQ